MSKDELRSIVASARTAGAEAVLQNYLRLLDREAEKAPENEQLREAIAIGREMLALVMKEGI